MIRNVKIGGFSLIEMMVVTVIIGILVALGVPKYRQFVAKSRQVEAKTNLAHIAMLENVHYAEKEEFLAMGVVGNAAGGSTGCPPSNALGFRPSNCTDLRYQYQVLGIATGVGTANEYLSQAINESSYGERIYPGCTNDDFWQLAMNKTGYPNEKIVPANNNSNNDVLVSCN